MTAQVTGGGGVSHGGSYRVRGSVAQPVMGRSRGGSGEGEAAVSYTLVGGWLGQIFPSGDPVQPSLRVRITEDWLMELSWDGNVVGFVLEFSGSIGPDADWQPVSPQPTGSGYTTLCEQPTCYFRLRRL